MTRRVNVAWQDGLLTTRRALLPSVDRGCHLFNPIPKRTVSEVFDLVVAPTGVWVVVVSPYYRGQVSGDPSTGNLLESVWPVEIRINWEKVRDLADGVREALSGRDGERVEVRPLVCFSRARIVHGPDGTRAVGACVPEDLIETITEGPGLYSPEEVAKIADDVERAYGDPPWATPAVGLQVGWEFMVADWRARYGRGSAGSPKGSSSRAAGPEPDWPSPDYDKLNLSGGALRSDNEWGIPMLYREDAVPDFLVPYDDRKVRAKEGAVPELNGATHFFLDDFRFESVWGRPLESLPKVLRGAEPGGGGLAPIALSPDFSLYPHYPLALQLFNVYRNRWCGAYWQLRGARVIPTVSWADERSYGFCFVGIGVGGTVAISTVGLGDCEGGAGPEKQRATEAFAKGYETMIKRIMPRALLVYGEVPPSVLLERAGADEDPAERFRVDVRTYPSR